VGDDSSITKNPAIIHKYSNIQSQYKFGPLEEKRNIIGSMYPKIYVLTEHNIEPLIFVNHFFEDLNHLANNLVREPARRDSIPPSRQC
jgi:hypothetical protein